MSQHAYTFDINDDGTTHTQEVGAAFRALASVNKGPTAPEIKYVGMEWIDDSATPWLVKRWDEADWIIEGEINATTNKFSPYVDGNAMGAVAKAFAAAATAIAARQTIKALFNGFLTKSSAYTVVAADDGKIIEVDATSASVTITLLAAATAAAGFTIAVKKMDPSANAVVIDGNAAETIDGAATFSLASRYDVVVLVSDGTKWDVTSVTKSTGTAVGNVVAVQDIGGGVPGLPALSGKLLTGITDQAFALAGVISPSTITADQNDYNPTGLATASMLRLSADAARTITGLAGGAAGRLATIHNIGASNIVLKDESASSTAANRFALAADLTIAPDQAVVIQYDATSSRWRSVGNPAVGGGWEPVSVQTFTAVSAVDFTTLAAGYEYDFAFIKITASAVSSFGIRVSDDNGATFKSNSQYDSGDDDSRTYGTFTNILLEAGYRAEARASLQVAGVSCYPFGKFAGAIKQYAGAWEAKARAWQYHSDLVVNAVRFFVSSGTMTGTVAAFRRKVV